MLTQLRQLSRPLGFEAIIVSLGRFLLLLELVLLCNPALGRAALFTLLQQPCSMDGLATMDVMENKLKKISTAESYTFQNQKGWRRWRILRPGWGMYHDVKRRLPYYWSDITDAFTYRTFASTVRMYFIK